VILKKLVVGPFATNCYIVGSELSKEGMIIDPGEAADDILRSVEDSGLDIKIIALTHGHIDHIGALKKVKEALGAEVAIHEDDLGVLKDGMLAKLFGLFHPAPPSPDRLLKEGDSLDVGDLHFKVIHTPGHTPGGICLQGCGIVFSGDTLFNCGIGRTDFPGGSYEQLISSIQDKSRSRPREHHWC